MGVKVSSSPPVTKKKKLKTGGLFLVHGASQVALVVKNSPALRNASSIPGLGRSPGGGYGNPLQYSCLENPHGQRGLVGYSPWGHEEWDMTEATSHACTQHESI